MSELTDKQARLAALYKIRDSGVTGIRSGDNRVEYRTMNDLITAIATLESEISALSGSKSSRAPKYIYQSSKGL